MSVKNISFVNLARLVCYRNLGTDELNYKRKKIISKYLKGVSTITKQKKFQNNTSVIYSSYQNTTIVPFSTMVKKLVQKFKKNKKIKIMANKKTH